MLKFVKSNWFLITACAMLVTVFMWLIKIDYFSYSVNLTQLLPIDTKLSVTLNMSELNTTINQKNKLIKNDIIKNIINNVFTELQQTTKQYNITWHSDIINLLEPEVIFYATDQHNEWGVLAKAQNKKLLSALQNSGDLIISMRFNNSNIYKLTTKNNSIIYFSFIDNNIISVSSSENLIKTNLNNYTANTNTNWQQRFSIINLEPILKIKIDPRARPQTFTNPLLTQFYQIIKPIIDNSNTELQIEFNQTGNYLTWQLSNIRAGDFDAVYNQNNIADSLAYINFKPAMLIGSYKPTQLINNNIQRSPLWAAASNFSAITTGLNLINNISTRTTNSILIAIKRGGIFFTVINETDLESTINTIYEILGKQTPKSVQHTLPDGSLYYELIADESRIQERNSRVDDKNITTIFAPNADVTFNYYQDGKKIIISTNYDSLAENIKSRETTQNQCLNNINFAELLYVDADIDNSLLNTYNLDEFTVFDQSFDENIVLKGCLKLQ